MGRTNYGTTLNLFHFENIRRLSVDIDLNYIGLADLKTMQKDCHIIDKKICMIFQRKQFELYRNPQHHASGKMVWRYPSALGQKGNLEIDLYYMYRQPLWPICWKIPEKSLNKFFDMLESLVRRFEIKSLRKIKFVATIHHCAKKALSIEKIFFMG